MDKKYFIEINWWVQYASILYLMDTWNIFYGIIYQFVEFGVSMVFLWIGLSLHSKNGVRSEFQSEIFIAKLCSIKIIRGTAFSCWQFWLRFSRSRFGLWLFPCQVVGMPSTLTKSMSNCSEFPLSHPEIAFFWHFQFSHVHRSPANEILYLLSIPFLWTGLVF